MQVTRFHRQVFTVSDVLNRDECEEMIERTERLGYEPAPITTGRGFVMAPEVRSNTRVMLDDVARAQRLWQRLGDRVPSGPSGWRAVGLNERFRFYRYDVGERFRWHYDGSFRRSPAECSLVTVMVYLNDGFDGGATEFDLGRELRVVPRRGTALVFDHPLRHQGAPVRRGRKYVMRTDVMYRRVAAAAAADRDEPPVAAAGRRSTASTMSL